MNTKSIALLFLGLTISTSTIAQAAEVVIECKVTNTHKEVGRTTQKTSEVYTITFDERTKAIIHPSSLTWSRCSGLHYMRDKRCECTVEDTSLGCFTESFNEGVSEVVSNFSINRYSGRFEGSLSIRSKILTNKTWVTERKGYCEGFTSRKF